MESVGNNGGFGCQSHDNGNFASQSDKELFDQIYQKNPELDSNKDGKVDMNELSDGLEQGKISLTDLLSMINNSLSGQETGAGQGGGQGGGGQGGGQQPTNPAPSDSSSSPTYEAPVDANGDGKIDASEFMKAFDKNQDGKLNAQELANGMQALGLGDGAKPQ